MEEFIVMLGRGQARKASSINIRSTRFNSGILVRDVSWEEIMAGYIST